MIYNRVYSTSGIVLVRLPHPRPLAFRLVGKPRQSTNCNDSHRAIVTVCTSAMRDLNRHARAQVMRANVGTDTEWASAAPDLDRFVVCAPTLFERFSSTGKVPDHPLLSGSTNEAGDSEEGAMGGGGDDPRGSPGVRSPGAISPGAPSNWQGSAAARGRRRASTSVGRPAAKEKSGSRSSSCKESARASGGGRSGSTFLASPPRARAVSVGSGMVGSLGKARRRIIDSGAGATPEAEASPTLASSNRLPV